MKIFLLILVGLTALLFAVKMIYVPCYLFPDVMHDLAQKLTSELKPGAIIISFNFNLPGLVPDQIVRPVGSLHSDPIYIYRVT